LKCKYFFLLKLSIGISHKNPPLTLVKNMVEYYLQSILFNVWNMNVSPMVMRYILQM